MSGDPIPVPDAVHNDSDSAWAMFNEVVRQHDAHFADTGPASPPHSLSPAEVAWARTQPPDAPEVKLPPLRRREAQPLFTLDAAMVVARRNNRVCPRPDAWQAFSVLLPPRKTTRGLQQPPAPATGAAWDATPSLSKRICFRGQLEWAERAGVLEDCIAFMQALPEDGWLHMGED